MGNKERLLSFFGVLLLISFGCATPQKTTLTSPEYKIIAPSPDLPPEIAAFLGKWEGVWDGGVETILIVERICREKALVIMVWGDSEMAGIKKGHAKYIAKVIHGPPAEIEFYSRDVKFSFEMSKDLKTIKGYHGPRMGVPGSITMKRVSQ